MGSCCDETVTLVLSWRLIQYTLCQRRCAYCEYGTWLWQQCMWAELSIKFVYQEHTGCCCCCCIHCFSLVLNTVENALTPANAHHLTFLHPDGKHCGELIHTHPGCPLNTAFANHNIHPGCQRCGQSVALLKFQLFLS